MKKKQPITDAVLLEAMRERLMSEIQRKNETNAIYNLVGSSASDLPGVRGVSDVMRQQGAPGHSQAPEGMSPDDFDYMVDIMRENLPADESGKSPGWKKQVHRYRTPKGEKPPGKKRARSE